MENALKESVLWQESFKKDVRPVTERLPFPPELRTLAFVPRWCIIATTVKQCVAEHSFFVAIYAYMIAEVLNWKGPRDYLMLDALLHDNDESITADITGTFKAAITDQDRSADLLFDKTNERMEGLIDAYYDLEDKIGEDWAGQAQCIRQVADKLDALLFLIINQRMGNTLVLPAIEGTIRSLEAAWRQLPAPKDVIDKTWQTVMLPTIEAHKVRGSRGAHPSIVI